MMKYRYWLAALSKLTNHKKIELIENGFTADRIYHMSLAELTDMDFLTEKDVNNIIVHQRDFDPDRKWAEFCQKGINFMSIEQEDFPEKLLNINNCPYGLFYIGNLPSKDEHVIAMVGARGRSVYGREVARKISGELAKAGVSVISGLALGIDGDSHSGALSENGTTYAVLGSGVDVCYPEKNRYIYDQIINSEKGGIISESIPGTPAVSYLFPPRNRIITGLSDGIIIVEARKKSGSLISADFAMDQGKEVYVVPGRITDTLSYGCNSLIEQGAHIVTGVDELLESVSDIWGNSYPVTDLKKIVLEKDESLVYSLLDFRPLGLFTLLDELNFDLSRLLEILESLQNRGFVEEIIPNYYAKVL